MFLAFDLAIERNPLDLFDWVSSRSRSFASLSQVCCALCDGLDRDSQCQGAPYSCYSCSRKQWAAFATLFRTWSAASVPARPSDTPASTTTASSSVPRSFAFATLLSHAVRWALCSAPSVDFAWRFGFLFSLAGLLGQPLVKWREFSAPTAMMPLAWSQSCSLVLLCRYWSP